MDIPNLIDDLLEDKVDVLERDDGVKIVSVVVLHIVGNEDQLLVLILLKKLHYCNIAFIFINIHHNVSLKSWSGKQELCH